jgi:hypothetical protein
LDKSKLDAIQSYMGGRGCIVRHGYLVYTWGDFTTPGDVASAAKPWYSTFLFKAVEDGRLASLDTPAVNYEPRLSTLNASLGYKDTNITFRHFASQTSCYGVQERPGTAFDYNDWQMALFWDTLFLKVYGAAYSSVDATVLHPMLTSILQCQDNPTFMAFGTGDRQGRLAVSPRDFARFGLLYLHGGNWNGTQVVSQSHATMAVTSPLPLSIPRTAAVAADMIPGQRSIGSTIVPDDQADDNGCYSWLWWVNGVQRNGQRRWPDAPVDVYTCLGHTNGKRGIAVMPSQDIVLAWNDTVLDTYPSDPDPLNPVFLYIMQSLTNTGTLVAYYRFEEGTGTTTADSGPSGFTGTLMNGPAWVPSPFGHSALHFNGASQYVNVGNPATLQISGPITLSAWVWPDALAVTNAGRIVDKQGGSGLYGWSLNVENTGKWAFQIAQSKTVLAALDVPIPSLPLSNWVHVAGVYDPYDPGGPVMKLYTNGVLGGTLTTGVPSAQVDSGLNVTIGARPGGSAAWSGLIDEVRIYTRALTNAEIAALAAPVFFPPMLINNQVILNWTGQGQLQAAPAVTGVYTNITPTPTPPYTTTVVPGQNRFFRLLSTP